jgi:hypothetical protein
VQTLCRKEIPMHNDAQIESYKYFRRDEFVFCMCIMHA